MKSKTKSWKCFSAVHEISYASWQTRFQREQAEINRMAALQLNQTRKKKDESRETNSCTKFRQQRYSYRFVNSLFHCIPFSPHIVMWAYGCNNELISIPLSFPGTRLRLGICWLQKLHDLDGAGVLPSDERRRYKQADLTNSFTDIRDIFYCLSPDIRLLVCVYKLACSNQSTVIVDVISFQLFLNINMEIFNWSHKSKIEKCLTRWCVFPEIWVKDNANKRHNEGFVSCSLTF